MPENPTLTLQLAEQVLRAQPFSVLLGTRITAFGDGAATLELDDGRGAGARRAGRAHIDHRGRQRS